MARRTKKAIEAARQEHVLRIWYDDIEPYFTSDYQRGRMHGRLMALLWVRGAEWADLDLEDDPVPSDEFNEFKERVARYLGVERVGEER